MAIIKEFAQATTILKFFDFKGAACVVDESTGTTVEENSRTILKAGTPYPSDDTSCKGFLMVDVDVTDGSAPATYIYEGTIDSTKIDEAVTISDEAKAAVPRVTFFD